MPDTELNLPTFCLLLEAAWILFLVSIAIGNIMMYFLSDQGIFETHSHSYE